jgi:basic membrane lipoprotein Med (substrate-binding protein (PBP1-ABC) superfamily)/DNA-binding SARP family transcriptional activator
MKFQVLGGIRVTDGTDEIDLGAGRQQTLLALLLANVNEVVSTDRILDHLWGDEADGKENALWVYISRLRSTLEPARTGRGESTVLLTRPPGYQLSIDPVDLDAAEFERLVGVARASIAADPATASRVLSEALALWRGPAFDGFDDDVLRGAAARLDETRINATEDRIEADLALGRDGELVPEIESLRRLQPLRERPVGQLMRALYRSGRAADALRVFDRFRRTLADDLGIDPSPELRRLEEQILLHDEHLRPRHDDGDADRPRSVNPFKGLRPFHEDDAPDFYGRTSLIADMIRAIGEGQRLIALVGSSGSGKSSVVRAGLIPALAKASIVGSDVWQIAYMVPAAHPFAEVEAALLRSTLNAPDSLSEQLRDAEQGLLRGALRVLQGPESRLVLVIDQFEELFTLVDDDEVRRRFLSNLVTLLDDPQGRITVIVTLRADFYGETLRHPAFGARLSGSVINVTPLSAEELTAAAVGPIDQLGITFEPALLTELTNDVSSQPGALPLFQYALTELFDNRQGPELTVGGYRELGGLHGALTQQADDIYEELDDEQQAAARQLFLRLVTITDGEHHARRRVAASELVTLGIDTVAMQRVIGAFGACRLLSFDADRLTGSPTVEVAHEALLTAWPKFEAWIEESRGDVQRHASLGVALREWELSARHPDYLLTGARLSEFESWRPTSTVTLSTTEIEFLDTAVRQRDDNDAAAAAQRRDDARARRRLWGLVAVLAASLAAVALLVSGIFAADRPTVGLYVQRDDDSWNANIAVGVDRAARELGLDVIDAPPTVDPRAELIDLAESAPDFIISDSFPTYTSPEIFSAYPDVRFGLVDAFVDEPNVTAITFANHEGAFLAGAAAAMKTKTGVVAFLGGSPYIVGDFQAGFEAGAHWVDPTVEVLATYIEGPWVAAYFPGAVYGFANPRLARERSIDLYELGADVVFHAAGTSGFGLFEAAQQYSDETGRVVWAIGVDNDQWFDVDELQQERILTSVIKRGDTAAFELLTLMMNDEGGVLRREVGLADDAFAYSTQGGRLTPDMVGTLDRAISEISTNRLQVPVVTSGPVLTLDPSQKALEAGLEGLTLADVREFLDGFVFPDHEEEFGSTCTGRDAEADMACSTLLTELADQWRARR